MKTLKTLLTGVLFLQKKMSKKASKKAFPRMVLILVSLFAMAQTGLVFAQGKSATFTLVDTAKVLTADVAGYYSETDPETGWVSYPAEGKFSVTLSPVPTNDVRYDDDGEVSFAWWENWKPLIKGTVIVHKPEGDVSFNISWRGVIHYQYNPWYNGYLQLETVIGVHETGPAFNEVGLDLFDLTPEGKLPDEGRANVRLSSYDSSQRGLSLSGSYKLDAPTATGWGEIRQGNKPATEYLKAKGTLPIFRMVDTAKHLAVNLSGFYRVGGWYGDKYPAEAVLYIILKPVPTDIMYYYKNWDGSESYDAWWENNPVSIQGTVVVHKPEGDMEFHINGAGTPVSGYDAYFRPLGPYPSQDGMWHNAISAAIMSPLHESGREKIDFYGDNGWGGDGFLDISCINPDGPQMTDQGTGWLELTGVEGELYLDGTYEARN